MTIRFVVDAQLPPGLAKHLTAAGFDAEHVNRIGLGAAADTEIWAHARKHQSILITKDGDFAEMARQGANGARVILVKIGNTTNRALWAAFSRALPEILTALNAGERLIEIA